MQNDIQEEVEREIGGYKKHRSSLYRHLKKSLIPIEDPANLPHEYRLTLRGRENLAADEGADVINDRMLLHQEDGLLIFSTDLDLDTLHESEFWVMDGTFQMCPAPFMQLYTIHGFKNGEG